MVVRFDAGNQISGQLLQGFTAGKFAYLLVITGRNLPPDPGYPGSQ